MARPARHGDLAVRIRDSILSFQDGWEIPSIRSLARLHEAAPDTVRKALRILVQQGEIAGRGPACRYVRSRQPDDLLFHKPYPAVALLALRWLNFNSDGYICRLLGGLFAGLSQRGIPATILPNPKLPVMSTIPGGIVVFPGQQRFSAVVYVSGAPDPVLISLVQAGVVVMSLDCVSEVAGVDSVAVDCESEAAAAAGFLARLGHTAIAFLAPRYTTVVRHWPDGVDPDALRFGQALLKAKQRLGLSASGAYHQLYPMDAALSDTPIRLAVDRLWRLDPAPSAVVCFDAVTGTHMREALEARGVRCPTDVSIVVRDCLPREAPAFSSLVANPHQIGLAAAAQLHDRLANSGSMPANLQLPSVLIEGCTTGPARCAGSHPPSWPGHWRS